MDHIFLSFSAINDSNPHNDAPLLNQLSTSQGLMDLLMCNYYFYPLPEIVFPKNTKTALFFLVDTLPIISSYLFFFISLITPQMS